MVEFFALEFESGAFFRELPLPYLVDLQDPFILILAHRRTAGGTSCKFASADDMNVLACATRSIHSGTSAARIRLWALCLLLRLLSSTSAR